MFWFTSDQHFNHANIINHTRRPFWSWKEMNDEIIRRHNSRVDPNDTVFHIGDFKFGANGPNTHELIKMLNGRHVFIRGNHDRNNGTNTIIRHAVIETYGLTILLVHKPDDALMIMSNGGIDMAFVGHVHHNWQFRPNMINIGVDVWDFYPVNAKQILKAYKKWEEMGI